MERLGSMTRAMRAVAPVRLSSRCLRVAVVRDGRIVDEQLCRAGEAIERAGVRFERRGEGYVLVLAPGMRARIAGMGEQHGPASVPIARDGRGRIDVEGAAVLFQMVDAPPARTRPELPAAVRGGFFASIDWPFSATTLASFTVFCTLAIVLEGMDYPIPQHTELPPSIAHMILEEPEPPPPDDPIYEADDEPVAETDTVAPSRESDPPRRRPRDRGEATVADASEVRRAAILQLGVLAGEAGSAFDMLIDGAPTTDSARLFADVEGVEVAHADTDRMRPRDGCTGDSCGSGGSLDGLVRAPIATRPVEAGRPLEERTITIRLPPHDGIDETGGAGVFDHALVTAAVRRRLGSIRRCYEHTMGARGDIEGKVTAEFTIQEAGNVTGVRAVENTTGSPRLARCVEDTLRTLRFEQGPDGGPLTVRYPFVFAEQR